MKKLLFIFSLLSWMIASNAVVAHTMKGDDKTYDDMFTRELKNTTDIATRTRLNSDDVPAFVTILYRDELLKLGINDIFEALCLVPGVEPYMDNSGARQLIFRGEKEKGKVKLLIDGMDVNNALRGSVYYYYDFPIELIERIEVIRGPGAVLYGSGAMSGVINIITRTSDPWSRSSAFGYAASYDTYRGGMIYKHNFHNLSLGIDGYYDQTNRQVKAGPDKGGSYGRSNENGNSYSVGMVAESGGLKFTSRFKRSKSGVAFGRFFYLEPDRTRDGLINSTFLSELMYSRSLSETISFTAKGGYSYYKETVDSMATPLDLGGMIFEVKYSEDKIYADLSIKAMMPAHNQLLAGFRFENHQQHKNSFRAYLVNGSGENLMPDHVIKPRVARHIGTFYLNDQYHINDSIDISFGLRYDINSDVDNTINPRAGIVYRIMENLNIKAMYSHSYRIPSWIELYMNVPVPFRSKPDISSEKSDTLELGLIYNNGDSHIGFNAYWTQINDIISYDSSSITYSQHGRHTFGGAELAIKQNFQENTSLDMNFSYVYGVDADNDKLPDTASWLGNVIFLHTFDFGLTCGTHLRFATKRLRETGDSRNDLKGYVVLDETLTYRIGPAEFTAGVNNILDHDVRYPAPQDTYPKDYPRPGRTYMFRIAYDF